jgi:DNA polymerase III subunit alpha
MGSGPSSEPLKGSFVHLHCHTHFSLLDGAAQIKPLVSRAKELGMDALAITDHGAMYGVIPFYEECLKQGIKPIIGVEAYMAARTRHDRDGRTDQKSFHQLLLAETFEGYQNLLFMTSEAHLNGMYYKPRIDMDLLREHSAGIIATSSCANGMIPRALQTSYEEGERVLAQFLEIFDRDHFYIELQHHPNSEELIELDGLLRRLAKEHDVKTICTNDVHYINKDDAEAQDVLVCVSSGKTVSDPNRLNMTDYDLSLSSPEEMAEHFADLPESLANTVDIANRCTVTIPMGDNILPVYPLPEEEIVAGTTDREYLRKMAKRGLMNRYGLDYTPDDSRAEGEMLASPPNDPAIPITERIIARVEYELSVIEKMGFESYFLIVQDFIVWSREQGIVVGPGRGSGAGSLVCYLLTITDVDPLKHNLIFERFLNPERISMPDIDTDIEDARRGEVIEYTRQRYGWDHVAQIATFGTMASRAAVKDVGRALGVSYNETDQLAKLIPSGPKGMSLNEATEQIPEIKELYAGNEQIRNLIDIAKKLEGCARHTSIHAAGVVISKDVLTKYLPIQRSSKDESAIVTQYAMSDVEHIGLLKMDFLGLSNLSILQQAVRIIRKVRGVDIDFRTLELEDTKTYELLARAETTGVFQLESSGMKRYLKELKPTNFEDIVAMVALYRPGPMDAIPGFIDSKHGRKKVTYLHPILEPILNMSYGVIVTQDQVLEVARKFAGFSYGQADVLRKAVGKKIKALLDEQREKFINGAVEVNKIPIKTAEAVWDFVEPFARYGFNRAHAVCYGMIAYQTAYLKANYPVEFMASLLTSDRDNLDRIGIEIAECKDMGVEVLAPDVNESFVEFGFVFYDKANHTIPAGKKFDGYVRFGLGAIKNVGVHPAEAIVEERTKNGPFVDFADFLRRCCHIVNRKVIENLAMAGALSAFGDRNLILSNIDNVLAFAQQVNKRRNSDQIDLFGGTEHAPSFHLELVPAEPAGERQKLTWEKELLGIYLSSHPIGPFKHNLPDDRHRIGELSALAEGEQAKVCGVVMSVRHIVTKKDAKSMAFVNIEDETGGVTVVLFPKTWAAKSELCVDGRALCIEGKISRKEGRDGENLETNILADTVSNITDAKLPDSHKKDVSALVLDIPDDGDRELLQNIKGALERHKGTIPVTLMLPSLEGSREMKITQRVEVSPALYSKLATMIGPERVSFR